MKKTSCYSYLCIESSGDVLPDVGFVAAENSFFEPDEITAMLGIQPFKTMRMGDPRKNGDRTYPFSSWSACRQDEPAMDAGEQCLAIVRQLRDKLPVLQEIARKTNVAFGIMIVPEVWDGEEPSMYLDREVIEFCHRVNASIQFDLYVYDNATMDALDDILASECRLTEELTALDLSSVTPAEAAEILHRLRKTAEEQRNRFLYRLRKPPEGT